MKLHPRKAQTTMVFVLFGGRCANLARDGVQRIRRWRWRWRWRLRFARKAQANAGYGQCHGQKWKAHRGSPLNWGRNGTPRILSSNVLF
jgi:hypothetical protein